MLQDSGLCVITVFMKLYATCARIHKIAKDHV